MTDEYKTLLYNKTWDLVPPRPFMNIVGRKLIFRIKEKSDGSIERYKASLVAHGYKHQHNIDYDETFIPVTKPQTMRTVLTLALSSNWHILQVDVKIVFLQGHLNELAYMKQPPKFIHPDYPNHVCRLKKALYRLKQAPRAWVHRFSQALISIGFMVSKGNTSLFQYHSSLVNISILLCVDDIIVCSNCSDALHRLSAVFVMKDLRPLHFFQGSKHHTNGLVLSQTKYIAELLQKFGLPNTKSVATPITNSQPLSAHDVESLFDPNTCRRMVGAL